MPRLSIPATTVMLFGVLAAVGFLTVACADSAQTKECTSQSCFADRFAQCQPATYETQHGLGAQARYKIKGQTPEGCALSLTYTANPNTAWVGKPLNFVLDPAQPLEAQLKAAVLSCLTGNGMGFHCGGALFDFLGGQAEDVKPSSNALAYGQTVKISGEPLYAMPHDGNHCLATMRQGDLLVRNKAHYIYIDTEGHIALEEPFSMDDINAHPEHGASIQPALTGAAYVHAA